MGKLSKKDCGEKILLVDFQKKLLEMLIELAKFCEKNQIRYYLSGGTLLGAIRHKGFIPWDDDIDVNIPRPDCEKLQNLSHGKIGKYELVPPTLNSEYPTNYWRLYDRSMVIENSYKKTCKIPVYQPVFIDIFPIEGLPDTEKRNIKHYRKIYICQKMINSVKGPLWHGKTLTARIAHLLGRPFAQIMGYNYWFNKIQEIASSIPFDSSDYIGVMMCQIHTTEERVKKSEFIPQIKVEFEKHQFFAPAGYDTYLCQLYGEDYMELPPIEKRKSHHDFKVYQNINY